LRRVQRNTFSRRFGKLLSLTLKQLRVAATLYAIGDFLGTAIRGGFKILLKRKIYE
jgi:hypothetical protein